MKSWTRTTNRAMTDPDTVTDLGIRDLALQLGYDTADDALRSFYVPTLARATRYDRSVGYFRASSLAAAAAGLARFIAGGGTARFLIGAEVAENEVEALVGATEIPEAFAARLAAALVTEDEIVQRRLEVLAWLVREGRLEIRVAVPVDEAGRPVSMAGAVPYFHEKLGIMTDASGDGVAFMGSINETAKGWQGNFESFSVYFSFDSSAPYYDHWVTSFERRWRGDVPGFRVFPLPEAVRSELVRMAPAEEPFGRDPLEPLTPAAVGALARFLLVAPHLESAGALAEATSSVRLFPHQRKIVARLADEYPRSWLVADEVGLGKTISAGTALRQLVLSGDVERALVLAPANVCRQWQDELFERLGLWVPRLDGGRIHGAHPDDVTPVPRSENPYALHPVLLVSSHLARLRVHQELILEAPRLDLLVVDEAHHARRRAADLHEYRPSRLLELLDKITAADHTEAVWLLTATPMQLHPVELFDLLRQLGLEGPLARYEEFSHFCAEIANTDRPPNWALLHRLLAATPRQAIDAADEAMLGGLTRRLGPVAGERVARFLRADSDPHALTAALGAEGLEALRGLARHFGPVGQFVTRHTRTTLRGYRAEGLLDEPIATRDVEAVPIPFSKRELDLYERLDDLLDRLMQRHGSRRGAGFVLTIYRRRLTSSWEAIRRTLRRRLEREGLALDLDLLDDLDEELEDEDGSTIDDTQVVPLDEQDLAEIRSYLEELEHVPDAKFDRLRHDLDAARGEGRATIVFTQYTDTLESLRDRLRPAYRSHLATYSGEGGRMWRDGEGWVPVSKQELVDALESRRVSVVLATDAASEGLNLQAASALICFDLPWNPMRIEQRIGRIDRIGQPSPVVTVRNYVVPGTVEQAVYAALASRIDLVHGIVGKLQPILGATEAAFTEVFRAPRSERATAQAAAIASLLRQADVLDRSGIDLDEEDPMPLSGHEVPPVALCDLERVLGDDLGVALDAPGEPSSFDPGRISRDAERWCALATYGHPRLRFALERLAAGSTSEQAALVIAEGGERAVAYRADRTPPMPVRSIAELNDLGASVSAGEAEMLARQKLSDVLEARRTRGEVMSATRRARIEMRLRHRFRMAVGRSVRAEQLLRLRRDGEAPDPRLVWFDLARPGEPGWQDAESLRELLSMPLDELLPRGGPGADARPARELAAVRAQSGSAIVEIIGEWSRSVGAATATPRPG